MASYIGLVRKEAKSDYGVDFPDFPGCITAGSTLEEARVMAQEALNAHIAWMIEDGDELPLPSSLDEIMADSENKGAVAIVVDVPDDIGKVERFNITAPTSAIKVIDSAARAEGKSRSGYLIQAALERTRAGLIFTTKPRHATVVRSGRSGHTAAARKEKARTAK